jgi:SAM-dependent methyltransferase
MNGFEEIDWNRLWRESRQRRSCKAKGSTDWDRKASSFARRNLNSSYVDRLLALIDPAPENTVLDVGAGPGTLAIPLARRVRQVTALDFSGQMLAELESRVAAQGIVNLTTVRGAWEDDWPALGLKPHDIAVASRSLSVDDLENALLKLNAFARQRVYITDRVGAGPFDPEVFAAVGRKFEPGPDYIYSVNLLYRLGIYARVDFIPAEYSAAYASRAEAVDSCRWMLDELRPGEEEKFNAFLEARLQQQPDGSWVMPRRHQPLWAVLWWDKVDGLADNYGFTTEIAENAETTD